MTLYRTIVADPPWQLKIGKTRTKAGVTDCGWYKTKPESNVLIYESMAPLAYPQMTVEQIAALKIPAERDAHCYLWTINHYIEDAFRVMRAWGFKPVTLLAWCKAPMGLGLGGTFVNTTEYVLFGRRGNLPAKTRIDRTWWNWKRGKHSTKPEAFQDIVEVVSPGPYLEMFARRRRLGWKCIGNGVDELDIKESIELIAIP